MQEKKFLSYFSLNITIISNWHTCKYILAFLFIESPQRGLQVVDPGIGSSDSGRRSRWDGRRECDARLGCRRPIRRRLASRSRLQHLGLQLRASLLVLKHLIRTICILYKTLTTSCNSYRKY